MYYTLASTFSSNNRRIRFLRKEIIPNLEYRIGQPPKFIESWIGNSSKYTLFIIRLLKRSNAMNDISVELFGIGIAATILTRYSSIPQIVKGIKTRKMDDVSFSLILFLTIGLALWVVYGIYLGDLIIIWANAIGVGSNVILIGLKVKYSKKPFG
jgi:MtN3 and saliva related transmembrane protein